MDIQHALNQLVQGHSLSQADMASIMRQIMTGQASAAQMGGFLVALRMKGETLDELAGAVQVMRELATPVHITTGPLVDTCGTGGDGAHLFNVSTASAFVVAAAGGKVAKHGNRSITSKTGSADLLEAAGVSLQLSPEQVAQCVNTLGVGFMFAQAHHSAMRHALAPRRELGIRTLFNLIGPMTNPAGAKRQVIGVFNHAFCLPMAEVLGRLGSEHVMVVHAEDGLDEISLACGTYVAEYHQGAIQEYRIHPSHFGMAEQTLDGLSVDSAQASLALIKDALGPRALPHGQKAADLIALNAGAALYVAGITLTLAQGVQLAEDTLASGLALQKLNDLVEFSACLAP